MGKESQVCGHGKPGMWARKAGFVVRLNPVYGQRKPDFLCRQTRFVRSVSMFVERGIWVCGYGSYVCGQWKLGFGQLKLGL